MIASTIITDTRNHGPYIALPDTFEIDVLQVVTDTQVLNASNQLFQDQTILGVDFSQNTENSLLGSDAPGALSCHAPWVDLGIYQDQDGKIIGAGAGASISDADKLTKRWMGVALLPQAGVAMGMALVASNQLPAFRQVLLPVVISTTIFFEIVGPIFTRMALRATKS